MHKLNTKIRGRNFSVISPQYLCKWVVMIYVGFFNSDLFAKEYIDMGLEELMQVPVTGSTLHDETLQTAPSVVTVFTHNDIAKMGIDYLYELINFVPGFQFDRNGDSPAGYTFSARGRRNSAESREVLLLVDGRVFADARTDGADGSLPLFPLEEIERVEIIRGPGSALYGSNAFNGVINIISRKGVNAAELILGSAQRKGVSLLLSQKNNNWQADVFGKIYQDDGLDYQIKRLQLPNYATDDPRKSYDLDVSLGNDNTTVRGAYHRLNTENFYIGEILRNSFNDYLQIFQNINVEHKFSLTESMHSTISLNYLKNSQDFHLMAIEENSLSAISFPASNAPLLIEAILAGESFRASFANDLTLSEKSSAQFGIEWQKNRETDARGYNNFDLGQLARGEFPINYYGDFSHYTTAGNLGDRESQGIYGQYLRDLSDSLRLTAGLRYDYYQNIGEHLSPRLGLVKQLDDSQSIKLLYGEAFRAPSLSEMGLKNNPVLVGNPNLAYEIVKTVDAVWLRSWSTFNLSANIFYSHYENPVVAGITGGTIRTYINAADEQANGLELESTWKINSNFSLRATHTHFFQLPENAYREAEHVSSIVLNIDSAKINLNIAAINQTQRKQIITANNERNLDGFWDINMKLSYQFSNDYTCSLQVKNILNENYSTPTQGQGLPYGVPNRGREINVGLSLKL